MHRDIVESLESVSGVLEEDDSNSFLQTCRDIVVWKLEKAVFSFSLKLCVK